MRRIGGGGVMRRSSAAFLSALPVFLFLSLLLFFYRSAVYFATLHLTSVLDHDPAVQSLLSRLSSSPSSDHPRPPEHRHFSPRTPGHLRRPSPRRRPPFLHLTHVGTLDDDLFSETDQAVDHHRYSLRQQGQSYNSTSFIDPGRLLHLDGGTLGLTRPLKSQNIRVSNPSASPILFLFPDNGEGEVEESDWAIEVRIFGQGFDLDRENAVLLVYLTMFFSAVHASAFIGFVSCYSCALGIVFFAVVSSLLGRHNSFLHTFCAGSRLGIRRLPVFVLLRWALRDAITQILCIWFFSDIKDQSSLLKLFVRMKLMPFSMTALPLSIQAGSDDTNNLLGFLFAWNLLDMVIGVVLAVCCWVAIMDHSERRSWREAVKEGIYLVSTMMGRANLISFLEMMVCGNIGRWVVSMVGGALCAVVVQSVAEVYFMVVWLMFYFELRCKDGELNGRRFGQRNLEDSIYGIG